MNIGKYYLILVVSCIAIACSSPSKPSVVTDEATAGLVQQPTSVAETPVAESVTTIDSFMGVWGCGRATINIAKVEESIEVNISWASSAAENTEWNYPCFFQPDSQVLVCEALGTKTDIIYNEDGEEHRTIAYTEGRAIFEIADGKLIWTDASESAGDDMQFVKE